MYAFKQFSFEITWRNVDKIFFPKSIIFVQRVSLNYKTMLIGRLGSLHNM